MPSATWQRRSNRSTVHRSVSRSPRSSPTSPEPATACSTNSATRTGRTDHPPSTTWWMRQPHCGQMCAAALFTTMESVNETAIEAAGLTKTYDDRTVVDIDHLSVRRGEVFGLLGPNGAGKTTFVEMCEGYRRPSSGQLSVLGVDPMSGG